MALKNDKKTNAARKTDYTPTVLKESFLYRIGDLLTSFFYRKASTSLMAGALTRYQDSGELFGNSLFAMLFKAITGWFSALNREITRILEESLTVRAVTRLKDILLFMSIRMWGLGLIFYAASMTGVVAARRYMQTGQVLLDATLIAGLATLIVGIAMLSSGRPLWNAVIGSTFFKQLFMKYAGLRFAGDTGSVYDINPVAPIVFGIAAGLLSAFTSPILVPAAVVAVCGAMMVMTNTEFGVLLLLFALPFAQTMQLAAICILVIFSFFVKLIRGKRRVRFDRYDVALLFFMAFLILFGGVFSLSPSSSMPQIALYTLFILTYFIAASTIRSREWADKAVWTLLSGALISALVGIYQYVGGFSQSLKWVDTDLFSTIESRVIGTFENPNVFGEFLIMLIPAAAAFFLTRRGVKRYYALGIFFALCAALVFTYSRGAWLALMIAFVLFLFVYSRGFFKFALIGVFAIPFLPSLLPANVVERFMSIGNMADSSTAYRVYIWIASLHLLERFWPCGIGSGVDVFMQVYPKYAFSGVAMAPHAHNLYLVLLVELGAAGFLCFMVTVVYYLKMVFNARATFKDRRTTAAVTALGAGIAGFLLQGLTDNVWYNFRVFLMFWLLIGITVAYCRSYQLEWGGEPQEY